MAYNNLSWVRRNIERRRHDPKKEILRITISDCIGNELAPGSIVTYSSGAKLNFGVYEGVAKTVPFRGRPNEFSYRIQLCKASASAGKVRRQVVGSIELVDGEFTSPGNMVVIKNPLYALGNSEVGKCLGAIDRLKDEGHLPEDFKVK